MGGAMSPAMPKRLPLSHLVPTLGHKNFPELRNPPSVCLGLISPFAADFPDSLEKSFWIKALWPNSYDQCKWSHLIVIVLNSVPFKCKNCHLNCFCHCAHNRAHSPQTNLWEVPQTLITLMCKMLLTGAPVKVQCHQLIFPLVLSPQTNLSARACCETSNLWPAPYVGPFLVENSNLTGALLADTVE